MPFEDLKQLLEQNLPNAKVYIVGDGCSLTFNIVSDDLVNLSSVKRQQQVYQVLQPLISDGTLHAVNMRFFAHDTWNNQ